MKMPTNIPMNQLVGMMTPRLKATLWSFPAKKDKKIWHGWTIEVMTMDQQRMPIVMHTYESHKLNTPRLFTCESDAKKDMGKFLENVEKKIKSGFARSALL